MPTTFKHLKSYKAPWTAKMPVSFSIAPAMATIVVDRVTVVHEQIAPIVGDEAESIVANPEDS
jgi:hypothetical protein